ncbi:MAG: tetratricopeptide repeat protein [Candidatus Ozemobacteraceae bacterium]
MGNVRYSRIESFPCLTISAPGGVMTWQDWMSDSLAFLSPHASAPTPESMLISFASGQTLFQTTLSPDQLKEIATSPAHLLFSEDLGEEQKFEGALLKTERMDASGGLLLGIQRAVHGNLAGALEAYDEAFAINPGVPRLSNLRGLCLRLLGRNEEAETAYLGEISFNPQSPDPYGNLGILYLKTDRKKLARTMFERALDRDQFYLNALLHLTRLLCEAEGTPNRLASSLNLRLVTIYGDLTQVQDQILQAAQKSGLSLSEYAGKMRAEAGLLSDPLLLRLMRRVELLRLNGALMACFRGFQLLLNRAEKQPPLRDFLSHWIARRLEMMTSDIPELLSPIWNNEREALLTRNPDIVSHAQKTPVATTSLSPEPPTKAEGALTPLEFFEMVLIEVMGDGQILPAEAHLVFRIKNALRIDEATHTRIFKNIEQRLRTSPLVDKGEEYNPKRLFSRLIAAATRDGKIEPAEKQLLNIAREAFEILPEELDPAFVEVMK